MDEGDINRVNFHILRYKEHLEARNYSPRTVDDYEKALRPFVEFLRGEDVKDLPSVGRESLHRYQMRVYAGRTRKGAPLSVWTQHGLLVPVKGFFRYLAKRGRILADPSAVIELPKCVRGLPRDILAPAEINRLFDKPDLDTPLGLRDRAILELLYSTGMRNRELAGLTVHDVNAAGGEVRVRRGKGGKDRILPMGEVAAHYVAAYMKSGRPRFLRLREKVNGAARPGPEGDGGLLFFGNKGKKLWGSVVAKIVGRHARAARLKAGMSPHTLRHTCATHMLRGGASVRHVQEMLGHKCLLSTQIYTHVAIDDLKKVHRRTHPRERPAGG